jgi:hypothetical protein
MTIVGTPITPAGEDSYLSYDVADAFFSNRLGTATWDAATASDKTKALNLATAAIDAIGFSGYKLLSTQDRQFPRKYLPSSSIDPWGNTYSEDPYGYIYESSTVPQDVLDACCLEALALLKYHASDDPLNEDDLQAKGVSSFSQGKLSVSFRGRSTHSSTGLRSSEAYDLLKKYIGRRSDIR